MLSSRVKKAFFGRCAGGARAIGSIKLGIFEFMSGGDNYFLLGKYLLENDKLWWVHRSDDRLGEHILSRFVGDEFLLATIPCGWLVIPSDPSSGTCAI
jgi:hypothetical protein